MGFNNAIKQLVKNRELANMDKETQLLKQETEAKTKRQEAKEKEEKLRQKQKDFIETKIDTLESKKNEVKSKVENHVAPFYVNILGDIESASKHFKRLNDKIKSKQSEIDKLKYKKLSAVQILLLKTAIAFVTAFGVIRLINGDDMLLESFTVFELFSKIIKDGQMGLYMDFVLQDFIIVSALAYIFSHLHKQFSNFFETKIYPNLGYVVSISIVGLYITSFLNGING
jgi:exonuclease VII large subunit